MQQTPNFNSKQIISKEELRLWDESLRELVGNVLRYNRNSDLVGGSLDAYDTNTSSLINDFFKVSLGSVQVEGYNTLKVGVGRGVLCVENTTTKKVSGLEYYNNSLSKQLVTLLKWEETDNITVDGIETYGSGDEVYMGFSPIWDPLEVGLCNISSSNQVTITGGDFTKLRGQSLKNPTKIRFYTELGAAAVNSETYEVISIIDDNNIIISGIVSNETNVKMLIVGSYDLDIQGSLTNKFSYVTANGKLTFTETASDITGAGGFIICKLVFGSGGAFTVVDLRGDYLFNFAYSPDIVYKSLVQTITGKKTFSTAVPSFASFLEYYLDSISAVTPITLTNGNNTSSLVIPDRNGSLFYITATGGYELVSITCTKSVLPGTSLFLKLDDSSVDLTIGVKVNSDPAVAWSIKTNDYALNYVVGPRVVIKSGSIIHLVLDKDNVWNLVNINSSWVDSPWVQVDKMYDTNSALISTATNKVYYKYDVNKLVINIERIAISVAVPITFVVPFTFSHKVVDFLQSYDSIEMTGKVTIDINGLVTIMTTTGIGNCYKTVIIYF